LIDTELFQRLSEHATKWNVAVDKSLETESSLIAFGRQNNQPVVLKIIKQPGDEWNCGTILEAFNGNGFVRAYEHAPGAVLMERLMPGGSLADLSLNGRDAEAFEILADVLARMFSVEVSNLHANLTQFPTVADWAKAFDRYVASSDRQIPKTLVQAGRDVFLELCASQQQPRLLHGDLHHYNVLFDSDRSWLAIDPKGVFGELEYEVGAVMRNPAESLPLFLSSSAIERRLEQLATRLSLNYERALRWTFAQAVLSAIWSVEDGDAVDATNTALRLTEVIRPMLGK
jgi:streptomycin 6-kinase